MEKKEEMLFELKDIVVRRLGEAGYEIGDDATAHILTDLKDEWRVFGYDSARLKAERSEVNSWKTVL